MKKQFIILTLILFFTQNAFAYEKIYLQRQSGAYYPTYQRNYVAPCACQNAYRYLSPYGYNQNYLINQRRLDRGLFRLIQLRRLQNAYFNNISIFKPKNQNGALSGYSVPIDNDSYEKIINSDSDDLMPKQKPSSNCTTELYSMPQGKDTYYKSNGKYYKTMGGIGGRTGVTIIYDWLIKFSIVDKTLST